MIENLSQIKLLICDVDGVLTDGRVFMVQPGLWARSFHILDGIGLKRLIKSGVLVGWVTGSDSVDIRERAEKLGVTELFMGVEEKWPVFESLMQKHGFNLSEIGYIGDDIPDLPILERVGFPVTVPNAHARVKGLKGIYCTERSGGEGAVRELCDMIMAAKEGSS